MINDFSIRDFKQLKVWQKAIDLSQDVYRISSKFPAFETYSLKSQLVRACCSISANVAEGNAIGTLYPKKELSLLGNAVGSAAETRSWLVIALNNMYISQEEYDALDEKTVEIIKMIYGCMKKVQGKLNSGEDKVPY